MAWAMHSGIWRDFAPTAGAKLSSHLYRFTRHGRSEKIDNFTLERISDALINAVSEERSCWLGWSLGATVVLEYSQAVS